MAADESMLFTCFLWIGIAVAVFDTLTAREILMTTARLKLPETVKHAELKRKVEEIIEKLDLGKCADTQVGKCSGGERRRLASASELISNPYLIFLDEPTSGLDGASALNVMTILRKLAHEEGRTIICTIHQPRASLLPVADQLVLLADGRQVYTGPTWSEGLRDGVLSYFAQLGFPCPAFENPADSIVDLINTVRHEDDEDDDAKPAEGAAIDQESTAAMPAAAGAIELASVTQGASGGTPLAKLGGAGDGTDAEAVSSPRRVVASVAALAALAGKEASPGAVDASGWAEGSEAHGLSQLKPRARVEAAMKLRAPMSREAFVEWLAGQYSQSALVSAASARVPEEDMPLHPLDALTTGKSRPSRYPTGFCTQMSVVLKRVMLFKLREPEGIATLAVGVILTCAIVGLVYLQLPITSAGALDRMGFLSVFLVTLAFAPLELVLLMPRERAVFLRDTNANLYGTAAFYVGRTLADLPFHLGFAAIGATIGYWMVGFQNDAAKFGIFLLMCVVLMFTAASLLLAISSISPDVATANGLASLVLLLAMLFSGIFIGEWPIQQFCVSLCGTTTAPLACPAASVLVHMCRPAFVGSPRAAQENTPIVFRWIGDVSFIRFGVEGLSTLELSGLAIPCTPAEVALGCVTDGSLVLQRRGFSTDASFVWTAIGWVALQGLIFRIISVIGLHFLFTKQTFAERLRLVCEW